MQNLCRHPKQDSLYPHRRRTSHSRYVVSRRVDEAIEKGYEVLEIHEVWHWEQTTDELFKGYVDTFLKLKQEANGYPKHCVTDEQKQQYIDEYYEHEGIRLDPNKIEYNPGLRALAKFALNSLWGT